MIKEYLNFMKGKSQMLDQTRVTKKEKANKQRGSTPIRVNNDNYEWIRREAFIKRDSIKNLTDILIEEAIQSRKEKKNN